MATKVRSAAELKAAAEEMKKKLREIERNARIQERLEEQQAREEAERRESEFNRDLIEFIKTLPAGKNGDTVYDYIMRRWNEAHPNKKDETDNVATSEPNTGTSTSEDYRQNYASTN